MHWMLILVAFVAHCRGNPQMDVFRRNGDARKPRSCSYLRTHGMLGADCFDLGLGEVPPNLSTSIEVLDLTRNRIREIYNHSFENYPYLKILYLTDNFILQVDAGAFEPIADLEILDLTLNSLQHVPEALSSLPALRKLTMEANPFKDVTFSETLPSIQYLSLSSCKLKRFPDFAPLPGLVQLNVSNNPLQAIQITQVAPMCSLKLLDLRKNPRLFRQQRCNCLLLQTWFKGLSREGFQLLPSLNDLCRNTTEGRDAMVEPEMCFDNGTEAILRAGEMIRRSCEAEVLKYGSGPLRLRGSARWVVIVLSSLSVIILCTFCLYYVRKGQSKLKSKDRSSERMTKARS